MRLVAGIVTVPDGYWPNFFTLTFARANAPDEDEAHRALRALMGRLRYRGMKKSYAWVLQRQNNGSGNVPVAPKGGEEPGTLHFHGILHLTGDAGRGQYKKRPKEQRDRLKIWNDLVVSSGFGPREDLSSAQPSHAIYIARYLSSRLARLNPVRRTFAFSKCFPRTEYEIEKIKKKEADALLRELGVEPECSWLPSGVITSWLYR